MATGPGPCPGPSPASLPTRVVLALLLLTATARTLSGALGVAASGGSADDAGFVGQEGEDPDLGMDAALWTDSEGPGRGLGPVWVLLRHALLGLCVLPAARVLLRCVASLVPY